MSWPALHDFVDRQLERSIFYSGWPKREREREAEIEHSSFAFYLIVERKYWESLAWLGEEKKNVRIQVVSITEKLKYDMHLKGSLVKLEAFERPSAYYPFTSQIVSPHTFRWFMTGMTL